MNWLKDKLDGKGPVYGIWLAAGSHVAAELAGAAGFDWALLDMEHGLGSEADVLRMIQVLAATPTAAVVRVPSAGSDQVKRVLDFGASGIMAPMIDSAADAAAFVRALRYPPAGTRGLTGSSRASGYGHGFAKYFGEANARLTGIVQIETARALARVDEIAAVDGVDVVFIGHSDLSLALGCFEDLKSRVMAEAEARVLEACARSGKTAGMLLKAGMPAAPYRDKGFRLIALGSDLGCLKAGYRKLLSENAP